MDAYYSGYYTENCHPERFTWFDSWKYPATVSHVISAILVPLNVFGGYCILFQSTEKMWRVKWPMFNLHLWTSVLDVLISLLLTPYMIVPLYCGFSVGLLDRLPGTVRLFLLQCALSYVAVSLLILFENRYNAVITDSRQKITGKWARFGFYAFNYTVGMVFLLPIYLKIPEQEAAKLRILKRIPCPAPEFFDERNFVLMDMEDRGMILIGCNITFLIYALQGLFFLTKTTRILVARNPNLSECTRQLQRKVFKFVCVQVAIPTVVLVVPSVYLGFSAVSLKYNQALTNTLTISISFHGMSSTLAILLIYEPYRNFTKLLIYRTFRLNTSRVGRSNSTVLSVIYD